MLKLLDCSLSVSTDFDGSIAALTLASYQPDQPVETLSSQFNC